MKQDETKSRCFNSHDENRDLLLAIASSLSGFSTDAIVFRTLGNFGNIVTTSSFFDSANEIILFMRSSRNGFGAISFIGLKLRRQANKRNCILEY